MSEGLTVGVLGNGGREAAMAAVYARSDQVDRVVGLGLNTGIDELEKGLSIDVAPTDFPNIIRAIDEHEISALFVGPEKPLIAGVVDEVQEWAEANGKEIAILGPNKNAAIEGSKVEQRELWESIGLHAPGFEWEVFSGVQDIPRAVDFMAERGAHNVVIKPDGETGGKGVSLPKDQNEANEVIADMLSGKIFKGATGRVIVETRVVGPEVSDISISDGNGRTIHLPTTQDHKRLRDSAEEGKDNPNTGGMGAYLPVPASIISDWSRQEIIGGVRMAQDRMAEQGRPYKGIWYEAELLEGDEVYRLEVNNRGGDPETQALLWAMTHAGIDVFELHHSAARGELSFAQSDIPEYLGFAAATLTFATEGYATAEKPTTGDEIFGIRNYGDNIHIDFAAVDKKDGRYFTAGGRTLYVTAVAETLEKALDDAYAVVGDEGIHWRGMIVRRTIGQQALAA